MPFARCAAVAAALAVAVPSTTYALDFSNVTCGDFLASGEANMAAMIMYLRGYHSGRSGVIPFDDHDQYAQRLGSFCKQHPRAGLIETSERILLDLSRGI